MSDSTKPSFAFERAELLASALHAQLLARRRPTFEHDLKNVIHGLLSGTELLRKALTTNSARIPPVECLTLLHQQLARARNTLQCMLAEIAPTAAPTNAVDLAELIEECVHDLRHELQRLRLETSLEPLLIVRAQRPRLKDAVLGTLLEAVDHAPPSSRLTLSARRAAPAHLMGRSPAADGDRVRLDISFPSAASDPSPSDLLAVIGEMLQPEDARVDVTTAAGKRCVSMQLPLATLPATTADANRPGADALRLIVVDANHDAADSLAMLVQLEGFEAQAAYDVESALQYVDARAPSAIIVDIDGSIDSGVLIARLREDGRSLRIVGLSYSPEPAVADIDAQLRKPLNPDALRSALEKD